MYRNLDFHARQYDPQLGRFNNVDPLADHAPGWTPYRMAFNNPILYVDPFGMFETEVAAMEYAKTNGITDYTTSYDDDAKLYVLYTDDKHIQQIGDKIEILQSTTMEEAIITQTSHLSENEESSIGEQQSNGGDNWDATIKTTGVVNDALGAAYSTTEAIVGGGIILTNKLNKASNVMNGVKIIKNVPAIGVVGTVSDAFDVGLDVYNGDYGKAVLKGGVLILKNTIRFSSPVGFAVITLIDLGISAYDLYNDINDD